MIIENKKTAGKARLAYLLTPFFYIAILGILIAADKITNVYLPVLITLFFTGILVLFSWLKLHYVHITTENHLLTIKYFSMSPMGGQKRIIEIPFNNLEKYGVKKTILQSEKGVVSVPTNKKRNCKISGCEFNIIFRKRLPTTYKRIKPDYRSINQFTNKPG